MKNIWFVSHYAMPPQYEERVKTLRYAQILKNRGYNIKLFTASTIHNTDINLINGEEKYIEATYDGLDYVHIKVNNYRGSGVKRILNLLSFSYKFPKVAKHFDKPDVIVADINCVNYKGIYKYCKNNGVKFFSDIRDLWPLSIVEYMDINKNNPIISYLYGQEKKLYKVSDGIIFSMEGGKDYIKDKGWEKVIDLDKVYSINNGLDYKKAIEISPDCHFPDKDLDDANTFKIIYMGSIRTANKVGAILDVAKNEAIKNSNIKFLVFGDGNERLQLENYCKENGLTNVIFKGTVAKKYVPYILKLADINIILVQQTNVMKYGCSLNKLFDYMGAGKPIVSNLKVNFDLLERYNCGFSVGAAASAMADKILEIKAMPNTEYDQLCQNALCAAADYDYEALTNQLLFVVNQ